MFILSDTDETIFSMMQSPLGEKDTDLPTLINAFQLIGMSSSLDLSGFFEKEVKAATELYFLLRSSKGLVNMSSC